MIGRDSFLRFSDIADALAQQPRATAPVMASGKPIDLALAVLRAWRDGQPVLPLENADLATPVPDSATAFAHLKRVPGVEQPERFVAFTAGQVASDVDRIVAAMDLRPDHPNVAAISLAHSYGFSSILLPMLLHGIPIQLVEIPFPAAVSEAMAAHDQVVLPAVPSMWRAWERGRTLDARRIRLAISAGAPLHSDLEWALWKSMDLKLHNFYGASECGGIAYDDRATPRESTHSLGFPLDGVEVTLGDAAQTLGVRSASVAVGYLPPDEVIFDGSFATDDCGAIRPDGELMFHGSVGDIINVAGRKISPARIESMMCESGLLDRVRVFGLPSSQPERVDEVAALIPQGTEVSPLRSWLSGKLEGWELPRHWFEAEDESAWAQDRRTLRERYARHE